MYRRACIAGALLLLCCGVLASAASGVWLDVPFVQQEKDGCGAASIAMVMQYWQQQQKQPGNPSADAGHIQQALFSRAAHGIYASAMEQYLHQNGYATFVFAGDRDLLQHHLEKGRPLIAALDPGSHLPLHYVVVVGFDEKAQLVILNDPAQRKLLKEDYSRFTKEWKAASFWTLLAVPNAVSH